MSELQTAVRLLHHVDAHALKQRRLARRTLVCLDRLPEGFVFPDEFRDRIEYDADRHLLIFHGYMSSADYFFLRSSSDDPEYLRAMNELHEKSGFDVHHPHRIVPMWLWGLVAASFALTVLVWFCWFLGSYG